MRTGWHFTFFSLPNLPELLIAGRERPFWTWYGDRANPARRNPADRLAERITGPARRGVFPRYRVLSCGCVRSHGVLVIACAGGTSAPGPADR
jgi:hypothetical protein